MPHSPIPILCIYLESSLVLTAPELCPRKATCEQAVFARTT